MSTLLDDLSNGGLATTFQMKHYSKTSNNENIKLTINPKSPKLVITAQIKRNSFRLLQKQQCLFNAPTNRGFWKRRL